MCSLPAFAIGAQLLGTGISAYGQIQAGNYANAAAKANAATLEAAAKDSEARGRVAEQNARLETNQAIGSQRASMAAAGLDVQSGSPLETLLGIRQIGELDALTIRNNAQREAWGYRTQARQERFAGRNARTQGRLAGFGTIVTGLGRTAVALNGLSVGM